VTRTAARNAREYCQVSVHVTILKCRAAPWLKPPTDDGLLSDITVSAMVKKTGC
jgi:hypothetical protein